MNKNELYQSLFKGYLSAFERTKSRKSCQEDVIKKWNEIKHDADLPGKIAILLKEYRSISMRAEGGLMQTWAKALIPKKSDKETNSSSVTLEFAPNSSQFYEPDQDVETVSEGVNTVKPVDSPAQLKCNRYVPHVQLQLQKEIDCLNSDICILQDRDKKGLLSDLQEKELKSKKLRKTELEKTLKRKRGDVERSQKARIAKKKRQEVAIKKNPSLRDELRVRTRPGQPRVEENQPLLLKTIIALAMHGSASHEKRQSDVYRTIKTLDELCDQLNKDGFKISRSGVYLRLLPRRSASIEGQRHVVTVPVKLIRAQNDHHAQHVDGPFCTATIRYLEELASFLGPQEVCFISQDDKCRVPIGLTAANKQSPLLMHVEYRVSLPDHDWVVAEKHKLIPSVYAGIQIHPNGFGNRECVSYSGPTYIAIRSGKHSSSTALSHAIDFEKLLDLKEFAEITRCGLDQLVKPIVIFTVDGGPDENPRYQKVIQIAIHHFVNHNLDGLFVATNAPGRSAFNRVERKMAPLSKELSGLILPHDHFGTHLDNSGRTIDEKLEEKNFEHAEIWSNLVVDKFPCVAEYVDPSNSEILRSNIVNQDQNWFDVHVRTIQYFTQIVKCQDESCCSKPRSSYFSIVPGRFLPPPLPISQTSEGLKIPERSKTESYFFPSLFVSQSLKLDDLIPRSAKAHKVIPYDLYCPSIQSSLNDRVCKTCHLYFASLVMLRSHVAQHKKMDAQASKKIRPTRVAARRQREMMVIIANQENEESVDWFEEVELDLDGVSVPPDSSTGFHGFPVISVEEHLKSVQWEDA